MPASGLPWTCQRIGFSCYFTHPIFSFLAATLFVKLLAKTTGNLLKISCFLLKAATPFLPTTPFLSQLEKAFLRRITHRDVFKMNVSDVVVGAALPGVIEPEGQGTRVPAIQGSEFAEGAVLDVDWSIIELNPSNGKIPKTHLEETERLGHDTLAWGWECIVDMYSPTALVSQLLSFFTALRMTPEFMFWKRRDFPPF